jgi:hypothetical protein
MTFITGVGSIAADVVWMTEATGDEYVHERVVPSTGQQA